MAEYILETQKINSVSDINKWGIIDWNRLNGYWDNDVTKPIEILNTWIVGHANITVIRDDLTRYPQRDDWPGWGHVGNHPYLGQLYWNMFYDCFTNLGSYIRFSDSPDFDGQLALPQGTFAIHGDIGRVSASTFIFTVMDMNRGDLWVSVLSEKTQVIIELCANVRNVFREKLSKTIHGK